MAYQPARDEPEITYAQFKALANCIPNLAWMARPDGWILWYNRRWYEYTGATPEEMAGWGWQSVHHPDVLPKMLERWMYAIEHGEPFKMIFPLKGKDGVYRPFLTRIEPLRENGAIVGWYGTNTDVTEQERQREHLQLLVNELNHRVKNTLATIHSIAVHSLREMKPDAAELFENRLLALAAVHDILTQESWTRAQIRQLVRTAVAPAGEVNFDMDGPDVDLSPRIAAALAMTLHELCTNAVKYGALSRDGRVAISWGVDASRNTPQLRFSWREYGGPAVDPPSRKGFGTRLIERTLAADAGGEVKLAYLRDGLRCEIAAPLCAEVLR
ncbi:sensor histidine kinase [Methylocystis sp. JAN1]|uniref:sensor histidine kinase n=1 Tax=Methylocystis sp. JAN1 TaxID=3397211 RepID=UPI003FA2E652